MDDRIDKAAVEVALEAIGKTFEQLEWDDDSWSGAFRNCLFGCSSNESSEHDEACYFVAVTNHLATLRAALASDDDSEAEPVKASGIPPWEVPLWDAINRVVVASGGSASNKSIQRQKACAEVSSVVRAALEAATVSKTESVGTRDVEAAIAAIEWDPGLWRGTWRQCVSEACNGDEKRGHDAGCPIALARVEIATLRAALAEKSCDTCDGDGFIVPIVWKDNGPYEPTEIDGDPVPCPECDEREVLRRERDEARAALAALVDRVERSEEPVYWRCPECGDAPDLSGRWRWLDQVPEHHHGYPVGHIKADRVQDDPPADPARVTVDRAGVDTALVAAEKIACGAIKWGGADACRASWNGACATIAGQIQDLRNKGSLHSAASEPRPDPEPDKALCECGHPEAAHLPETVFSDGGCARKGCHCRGWSERQPEGGA